MENSLINKVTCCSAACFILLLVDANVAPNRILYCFSLSLMCHFSVILSKAAAETPCFYIKVHQKVLFIYILYTRIVIRMGKRKKKVSTCIYQYFRMPKYLFIDKRIIAF